jgi:hypothetical protein
MNYDKKRKKQRKKNIFSLPLLKYGSEKFSLPLIRGGSENFSQTGYFFIPEG